MELVKKGGVQAAERKPDEKKPQDFVYRCPHDGAERDTPGPCPKCGMALDERHQAPRGAEEKERKIYVCEEHPESVSEKPGRCFKDT
jgi:hypothetical protein